MNQQELQDLEEQQHQGYYIPYVTGPGTGTGPVGQLGLPEHSLADGKRDVNGNFTINKTNWSNGSHKTHRYNTSNIYNERFRKR